VVVVERAGRVAPQAVAVLAQLVVGLGGAELVDNVQSCERSHPVEAFWIAEVLPVGRLQIGERFDGLAEILPVRLRVPVVREKPSGAVDHPEVAVCVADVTVVVYEAMYKVGKLAKAAASSPIRRHWPCTS